MDRTTLRFNPRVEVSDLDCSAAERMVICELRGRSGAAARYTLPARVVELLRLFNGERATAAVLDRYESTYPDRHRRESLESLVRDFLVPKGLLIAGDADAAEIEPRPSRGRSAYLHLKVPLLPARVVHPIARALAPVFHPVAATVGVALTLVSHLFFYFAIAPGAALDPGRINGLDVLAVMVLLNVGALVHELGHATAAVRFGCRGAQIGWGIYIYFTVLYADVSEAWKLPRFQRAVVDTGGLYFQSLFLAGMLALYAWTGSAVPLYVFLLTDISMAGALNPFLRMDGYWLLGDLFGIVNLREQSAKLGRLLAARVMGVRGGEMPEWKLDRKATFALCVYTVLSVAFFGFMIVVTIRWIGAGLFTSLMERFAALQSLLVSGEASVLAVLGAVIEVLWRCMVVFGVSVFAYRITRAAVRWLARLRVLLRGRAVRRASDPGLERPAEI